MSRSRRSSCSSSCSGSHSHTSGCPSLTAREKSTGSSGWWKKLSALMPYMWPNDRMLQFRLFVCIVLLAGTN